MLYLVATPIGNLADITLRAIDILKQVDCIAAEDTRHSQRLLLHYQINTPCFSLHDHNEEDRIEKILMLLRDKKSIALISDAGTPLISDPGFKIVRAVREAGFQVTPIPGACALIAALIASGLPTDRFSFEGFLPVKTSALENQLTALLRETRTMIFYESSHRIEKTLLSMKKILGDDRITVIARELTKTFETIQSGSLNALTEWILLPNQQKGEFVIVVSGAPATEQSDAQLHQLLSILLKEVSLKQSVNLACQISGAPKNRVYALAVDIQSK